MNGHRWSYRLLAGILPPMIMSAVLFGAGLHTHLDRNPWLIVLTVSFELLVTVCSVLGEELYIERKLHKWQVDTPHPKYMEYLCKFIPRVKERYVGVCSISFSELWQYGNFFTMLEQTFQKNQVPKNNRYRFIVCSVNVLRDERDKPHTEECIEWHNRNQRLFWLSEENYKIILNAEGLEFRVEDMGLGDDWMCGYRDLHREGNPMLCTVIKIKGRRKISGFEKFANALINSHLISREIKSLNEIDEILKKHGK